MTFRTRLLVVFAGTIVAAVAMIVWIVSVSTARVFEQLDAERTAALVQQFQKEFVLRGEEIAGAAQRIADSDAALRVAIDVNRAEPDYSLHVNDATALASSHGLDFLELVAGDGSIVSSAQWPRALRIKKPGSLSRWTGNRSPHFSSVRICPTMPHWRSKPCASAQWATPGSM